MEAFGDSGEGGREVAFGCREEAEVGRGGTGGTGTRFERRVDEQVGEE